MTKMATSGLLAVSSDLVAQSYEGISWDQRRSLGFAAFGFGYMGYFQHHLFAWYARRWPIGMKNSLSKNTRPVLFTVSAHMLVTYPFIYFPAFVIVTDTLARGKSFSSAWDHLLAEWWRLYKPGFLIWTPVMAAQFLFIPLPLQVLWITSFSFAWTTFMSLSMYQYDQITGSVPSPGTSS
jgi:hypothetical protein